MKRNEAIKLAQDVAGEHSLEHDYLPTGDSKREWQPHEWVVDAILRAARLADRRHYHAACAPITYEVAKNAFGCGTRGPELSCDTDRAAFMAVWALLAVEYADQLIKQFNQEEPS